MMLCACLVSAADYLASESHHPRVSRNSAILHLDTVPFDGCDLPSANSVTLLCLHAYWLAKLSAFDHEVWDLRAAYERQHAYMRRGTVSLARSQGRTSILQEYWWPAKLQRHGCCKLPQSCCWWLCLRMLAGWPSSQPDYHTAFMRHSLVLALITHWAWQGLQWMHPMWAPRVSLSDNEGSHDLMLHSLQVVMASPTVSPLACCTVV